MLRACFKTRNTGSSREEHGSFAMDNDRRARRNKRSICRPTRRRQLRWQMVGRSHHRSRHMRSRVSVDARYSGGRAVDIGEVARPSGGISPNGAVSIRLVRNRDYATATGRLSGDWAAAAGARRHLPAVAAGALSGAARLLALRHKSGIIMQCEIAGRF